MKPIIRNILAVIVGIIIGSVVNMGLINISPKVIPPPPGADLTTLEGLQAAMKLMEPKHFIMPFLAHALGTFVGAYIAARLGATHKQLLAYIIGIFFLIGGVMNIQMLPSPMWYNIIDIVLAYIPMSWIAGKIATHRMNA